MKNNKAITLIALVVTIIVLLILAGVSIALISGGNGILDKATNAVNKTNESTEIEETELLFAELQADYYEEKYVNGNNVGKYGDYIKEKLNNTGKELSSEAKVKIDEEGKVYYAGKNDANWKEIGTFNYETEKLQINGKVITGAVVEREPEKQVVPQTNSLIVNVESEDNIISDFNTKNIVIKKVDDNTEQTYQLQNGERTHTFEKLEVGKEYEITIDEYLSDIYEFNKPTQSIIISSDDVVNLKYEVQKMYLYKEGNECVNITNGYKAMTRNSGFSATKYGTYLLLNYSRNYSNGGEAGFITNKKIDLTKYSKLCLNVDYSDTVTDVGTDGGCVTVFKDAVSYPSEYMTNQTGSKNFRAGNGDISECIGEYYVQIWMYDWTTDSSSLLKLYSMWLE